MKIRELLQKDMSHLAQCLNALGDTNFEGREWAGPLYLKLREGCQIKTFVAVDENDIPIGTASLIMEPKLLYAGSWGGHIEDVSVRKDQQGKGVGRALVQYLVNLCKSKPGCYKIVLNCAHDKVAFYEKFGFYKTDTAYMRIDLPEEKHEDPLTEKGLIGRMIKGDIEAVYLLPQVLKTDKYPYRQDRYDHCLKTYEARGPETLIKEVLVHVLGVCPKCGSGNTSVHNYSMMWHDGDVICDDCGTYVRGYDAG